MTIVKAQTTLEGAVAVEEKSRTYNYGKELGKVKIEKVTELVVRESGTHRLKTADGRLYIQPTGWIGIEIEAADWTV